MNSPFENNGTHSPDHVDFSHSSVLVVDDDAASCADTVGKLARLGCCADCAADGNEALAALADKTYDIVFMDCQMPQLDGFAATRKIRCEPSWKQPVIVALTSDTSLANHEKCLHSGMNGFLGKPARAEDLEHHLNRLQTEATHNDKQSTTRGAEETKLIALFLRDAPARIEAMQGAFARRDCATIEQAAHALKGSSGVVGATGLVERCEVLEELGKMGLIRQVEEALMRCKLEFAKVRAELEHQLAQKESDYQI